MSAVRGESRSQRNAMWIIGLATVGAFVTSLDVVVVSTALPSMQRSFRASLADLEWTINGYNLAFACAMLTASSIGNRFGKRNTYVAGLLVFVASSIACAAADDTGLLIAARVVQGIGAAAVLPLSLSLVSDAFPAAKRGAAIGIWGAVTGLGVAAGPVVGGAIVQGLDWQWIFWVNVPVGLLTAVLCLVKVPESFGGRSRLDLMGLALAAAGLFALTWAAVRAPSIGWGDNEVIIALAFGGLLLAAFVTWEARSPAPMIPLSYFASRGFSSANGVAFVMAFSLIGSLFMIAQMFQLGLGHDPLGAGARMLVWNAMPMLVAPIAGTLSDRFGNRPFMVGGMILQAVGLFWLAAEAGSDVAYPSLIGPLATAGIGISLVFPTVANAVVGSVPLDESALAAGTNNTLREAGGVFGVAVLAAVFAATGSYASRASFMSGFRHAEFVAAAAAVLGAAIASFAPSRLAAAVPAEPIATVGDVVPVPQLEG